MRLKREIFQQGWNVWNGEGGRGEGKKGRRKKKRKKNERNVFLPGLANGLVNKLYPTNPDLHAGH